MCRVEKKTEKPPTYRVCTEGWLYHGIASVRYTTSINRTHAEVIAKEIYKYEDHSKELLLYLYTSQKETQIIITQHFHSRNLVSSTGFTECSRWRGNCSVEFTRTLIITLT